MLTRTEKIQQQLRGLWTITDLSKRFRVTGMTIINWCDNRDLPCIRLRGDKKNAFRFVPEDVQKWAERNKLRMHERIQREPLKRAA